jgi:hypothetical protein
VPRQHSKWLGNNITDPVKAKTPGSSSSAAKVPFLYSILTLAEAAAWWRMRPRELSLRSKGNRARIPGIWINQRVVRFSPLIMLAQVAGRAGIPMKDFLAAVISQIPPYSDWNQLRSELEKIDKSIDEDRGW